MSNDAIFVLDDEPKKPDVPLETPTQEYLTVQGSLKELADRGLAASARNNLHVYEIDEVDDLLARLENIVNTNKSDIGLSISTLRQSLDNIAEVQNDFVKLDGTTSFENVLKGITPSDSTKNALTTVEYIAEKLKSYLTTSKVQDKINEVLAKLENYTLVSDVYNKKETYSQALVDKILKDNYAKVSDYAKISGKWEGPYPKSRSLLATKGYIDDVISTHKNEYDAHKLLTIIDNKLSNYYKKSETYTKALTYSRQLIDSIIDTLVNDACAGIIETHLNTTQHLTSLEVQLIIKAYVIANLITKNDLKEALLEVDDKIEGVAPIWKTSGPVLTTVGFVEDNDELPSEMTLQEILDAIFYGAKISILVDENVAVGKTTEVTVCLHGGLPAESMTIYLNDEILAELTEEDLEGGCATIESKPVTEDTEFRFEVIYSNGMKEEETATVRALAPVFIGMIPKFRAGKDLSYSDLVDLTKEDKVNNKLYLGESSDTLTHEYSFSGIEWKNLIIAVPESYPDLSSMSTPSQAFGPEAFHVVKSPFIVLENGPIVPYKLYIYKESLIRANFQVTFKF